MKSTSFEIQIPSKCNVSESNFRPHEKGDWCISCRKTVVDFTAMSDADIIRFFQDKPADAQICGTWRNEQLNKPFRSVPVSQPASGWWPVVLGSFLTVLSVGKISAQATDPLNWRPVPTDTNSIQELSPEIVEEKQTHQKEGSEKKEEIKPGFRKITVRLKLKYQWRTMDSRLLEGVCEETSEKILIDEKGVCHLVVPDSSEEYSLTLSLKIRKGYRKRVQLVHIIPGKTKYKVKFQFYLKFRNYTRGKLVMVPKSEHQGVWQRIRSFFFRDLEQKGSADLLT